MADTSLSVAMPNYIWVCHSCKESNVPGGKMCCSCGFPAVASAADIEEIVTGVKRPLHQSRKEWQAARRSDIAAMPLWKKLLTHALQAAQLGGSVLVFIGIFDLSITTFLFGLLGVVIAEVLFQTLKGPPYAWMEN